MLEEIITNTSSSIILEAGERGQLVHQSSKGWAILWFLKMRTDTGHHLLYVWTSRHFKLLQSCALDVVVWIVDGKRMHLFSASLSKAFYIASRSPIRTHIYIYIYI